MPRDIIDDAKGLLEPGDERTEELIDQIRARRDDIANLQQRAQQAEEEARALRRRAAQSIREADEIRRTAREDAIAEVERELEDARRAIRDLQRVTASDLSRRPQRMAQAEAVESVERDIRLAHRKERRGPSPQVNQPKRPLRTGDKVSIVSLDQKGEVISVDGNEAEVQMGALKVRQPLSNLVRLGGSSETSRTQRQLPPALTETVPIEIDLRGYRADEVASALERYVNDAYLSGLPWVRIIHGKGTGTLRQVVRDELRTLPVVERSAAAGSNEGGEGATVAFLRQG
jgi:DNA mismatch repair protein MutS2